MADWIDEDLGIKPKRDWIDDDLAKASPPAPPAAKPSPAPARSSLLPPPRMTAADIAAKQLADDRRPQAVEGVKPSEEEVRELTPAVSQAESLGRGAQQGATLGFSDELGAGRAAFGGLDPGEMFTPGETFTEREIKERKAAGKTGRDVYVEERDKERKLNEDARRANPKTYLAGEVGGGIALPAGAAGQGAKFGAKVLAGAAAGAVTGAVAGAGHQESAPGETATAKEVAKAAGVGGTIGAALGAAGTAAVEGVKAGVGAVRRALSPEAAAARVEAKALRTATKKVDKSIRDPIADNKDLALKVIREEAIDIADPSAMAAGGKAAATRADEAARSALKEAQPFDATAVVDRLEKIKATAKSPKNIETIQKSIDKLKAQYVPDPPLDDAGLLKQLADSAPKQVRDAIADQSDDMIKLAREAKIDLKDPAKALEGAESLATSARKLADDAMTNAGEFDAGEIVGRLRRVEQSFKNPKNVQTAQSVIDGVETRWVPERPLDDAGLLRRLADGGSGKTRDKFASRGSDFVEVAKRNGLDKTVRDPAAHAAASREATAKVGKAIGDFQATLPEDTALARKVLDNLAKLEADYTGRSAMKPQLAEIRKYARDFLADHGELDEAAVKQLQEDGIGALLRARPAVAQRPISPRTVRRETTDLQGRAFEAGGQFDPKIAARLKRELSGAVDSALDEHIASLGTDVKKTYDSLNREYSILKSISDTAAARARSAALSPPPPAPAMATGKMTARELVQLADELAVPRPGKANKPNERLANELRKMLDDRAPELAKHRQTAETADLLAKAARARARGPVDPVASPKTGKLTAEEVLDLADEIKPREKSIISKREAIKVRPRRVPSEQMAGALREMVDEAVPAAKEHLQRREMADLITQAGIARAREKVFEPGIIEKLQKNPNIDVGRMPAAIGLKLVGAAQEQADEILARAATAKTPREGAAVISIASKWASKAILSEPARQSFVRQVAAAVAGRRGETPSAAVADDGLEWPDDSEEPEWPDDQVASAGATP